ncbi:hypothetical protein Sste5344_004558 [Sporothrix stenoceras]
MPAQGVDVEDPTRGVLAFDKTPATHDSTSGVETALKAALDSKIDHSRIASVTIGTTAFLNAVIERDPRRPHDWPPDLASNVRGYVGYVDGDLNIYGSEEAPIAE